MPTERTPEPISALLDSLNDGILILAADATVLGANSAASTLLGPSPDDLLGRTLWSALPELRGSRLAAELDRARLEGGPSSFSLCYGEDGRQFSVRIHPHMDGMAVQLRDITHERAVAERIERSEAMLATAQKIAGLGAWRLGVVATAAIDLSWSQETYRIHGIALGSVAIEPEMAAKLVHPSDRRRVRVATAAAITRRQAIDLRYRIVRPDGDVRRVHVLGMPEIDSDGQMTALRGSIQDDTEGHQLRSALRRDQARLAACERDLQQIRTIAAHDLREPLRKLQVLSDLFAERVMQARFDRNEAVDIAARIASTSGRIQRLIDDLQQFVAASTQSGALASVTIETLIEAALERLRGGHAPTPPQIILEDHAGPFQGDRRLLETVLANLLENSVQCRHPDREPVVVVAAERFAPDGGEDDGWLRLSCRDNGCGFDSRFAERIFDPFEQLAATGSASGSGMGLALVRRIVERLGGSVSAEGEIGVGATIRIDIPLPPDVIGESRPERPDTAGTD